MRYEVSLIKKARLIRGWSQKRLAEASGVDPVTVGRVETGQTENPATIKKLADALELPMEELVVDEPANAH